MKTKNNVQKAALKAIAALSIFIFAIGITVSGAEKKTKALKNNAIRITETTDQKMEIEKWMIDNTFFDVGNLLAPVAEAPMKIEAWMTEDKLFDSAVAALAPAPEPALIIEDWMFDKNSFTTKKLTLENSTSKKVELWKVQDEKYGNRKLILSQVKDRELKVENWMLDNKIW